MHKSSGVAFAFLVALAGSGATPARADDYDRFAQLDQNRDGSVTLRELENHVLVRFAKADLNRDGKLTSEERNAELEARSKERFLDQDLNHDGVLERMEVEQMPHAVFYQIDLDRSGGLNPNEIKAFARVRQSARTAAQDLDGDGVISQAEAAARARARFAKLDENHDGRVDEVEFFDPRAR